MSFCPCIVRERILCGQYFFGPIVSLNIVIALLSFLWSTWPRYLGKLSASNMLSLAALFFPNEE